MKYLSDYTQQPQTALFDELGAFFAFSNKQFDEAKKKGIEYVSLGMGMIVPKNNAKKLVERLEEIQKEGIKQDIAENGKEAIIRRELFNHECFYTGDICDCVEKLDEYGYSYDDIYQVYSHICKTEDVY
jgi:DNA-binding transcriptional regulator YhcF (GntR family)